MRGKNECQYPFNYLETINTIFGKEENTIEVCSGHVDDECFKVDINPNTNPDLISDGQSLVSVANGKNSGWRCDL